MNRLVFSIDIQAQKSVIWKALWDESSYREWAKVFFEGSYVHAENWEEGSKVLFLSPDHSGIYSLIDTHVPDEMITFEHKGNVVKGEEQPMDDDTKAWSGAMETYRLTEGKDHITLTIEIDVLDEHLEFMTDRLPIALEKVKHIAEAE